MTPAATAISRKRNRTLALISERNISGACSAGRFRKRPAG
jgi:hypothetical protein